MENMYNSSGEEDEPMAPEPEPFLQLATAALCSPPIAAGVPLLPITTGVHCSVVIPTSKTIILACEYSVM